MTESQGVLAEAFLVLSPEQKENLRWHAEQGTRICCGVHAAAYYHEGAG